MLLPRSARLACSTLALLAVVAAVPSAFAQPQPEPEPEPEPDPFVWSGYIQAQYEVHGDSQNELDGANLLNQDRFLIRRGRLKLKYEGIEHARFVLEIDATSTGVSAKEVVASLIEPWTCWDFELGVGLFKVPFGYETMMSQADLVFPESSVLGRTLFPGERDVGVRLSGKYGAFRPSLALVNGDPIGERAFPGRDPNAFKDLVGRFGLAFPLLDLGVSGQVGTELQAGSPETETEPAVPSENATRWRVGFDAELHHDIAGFGKLELFGEVAYAHRAATDLAGEGRLLAGYLAVVQHWGEHVGVAFRAQWIDPDLAASATNDRQTILSPVLLLHPVSAVRLSFTYDVVLEEPGAAKSNDVFTARVQVRF